ncbi:8-amino-7-oxononanoate synthase [Methylomarinum sp. Ch1-1]|uniref:8-amino-7-oxononanoate synthase n=1 Tax=Methylomarinum roseum TaxID=3067653 RepID=A0AAU7NZX1_9GAMM|nr:8-amino-7-oxononanoate synthase [Methylomarinum sp. Ch1-1]MDP4521343.1 8-amino-7-oxononanoate synthase [Methylomarinum sp. Ch1-1]
MNPTERLAQLKEQGLYRRRRVIEGAQGIEVWVDGERLINFSSNDYLGLANHPAVVSALKNGAERYGVGSGSAHLICGHSSAHHALEEELADFTGRRRALLFSTGYMANIGVISALVGRSDKVLEDRLNHASLLDGGLLSRAQFQRYRHADSADLEDKLSGSSRRQLIVTDGVFSMDGDLAPLPAMAKLAEEHQATLMVDDAHGIGVLGDHGAGVLQHFGLSQQQVPVLMGTLGKGLGTFGAFVAGSEDLIELLIQQARSYVFTTAMPAAVAEATRASLKIVRTEPWRREKLQMLSQRFREGASQLGWRLLDSASAIQPILIGDSRQTIAASEALLRQGYWVGAIRPPTVPQGQARLRVTFSANHQQQHVDGLLTALAAIKL